MPALAAKIRVSSLFALPASIALTNGAAHLEHLGLFEDLDHDVLAEDLRHIAAVLDGHDLDVAMLLDQAGRLLARMVGVTQLHSFASSEVANPANRLRNTLIACLAAQAHAIDEPTARVIGAAPAVMPRGTGNRRAEDDEILLLRLNAITTTEAGGRSLRRALTYILQEAGARTGETTAVRFSALDDVRHPRSITLPGGRHVQPRTVNLPLWALPSLERILGTLLAHADSVPSGTIAYTGNYAPGSSKASASACGMLRSAITAAGLNTRTLDPQGITRWRIAQVIRERGHVEGRRVYGGTSLDGAVGFSRNDDDSTPSHPQPVDLLEYVPFFQATP